LQHAKVFLLQLLCDLKLNHRHRFAATPSAHARTLRSGEWRASFLIGHAARWTVFFALGNHFEEQLRYEVQFVQVKPIRQLDHPHLGDCAAVSFQEVQE
jgi:hypothetical protein